MDFSKLVFKTVSAVAVLGLIFLAGLFSAHRENAIYRWVYDKYSSVKLVYKEIPNLRRTRPIHFVRPARYEGSGLTLNTFADKTDDYMLLSGFFMDDGGNSVRLIERDGTIVNKWPVSVFDTVKDPSFCRNPPATEWNAIPHGTIIEPDGSIIFSFESCGMVKLDRCAKPIWAKTDIITHHSPNFTESGDIVIAGGARITTDILPHRWPYDEEYWEDLIYIFDQDGNLLRSKSMTELFIENDFQPILTANGMFSTWISGEFHLNEVEELSSELAPAFPMFEAGDLMLSIRNRNLIMIVDAAMEKIKWYHIGPWIRQHDPDFNPDGTITLYDNNTDETDQGTRSGGSRIYQIDPKTNETRVLYGGTPETHFYSRERSTHQMLENGSILVTEAQGGRVFQVDRTGKLEWEWVNLYDEEYVNWMHDASIIPKDYFEVEDWACN